MDRSASKHTPNPTSPADRGASEIRDGLVLAFLARKRLLVLVGEAGAARNAVYRQLVEHVDSDGAMVLPVTATVGAEVEELILAAGAGALPDTAAPNTADDAGDPDFDALIGALEERLDLAGSGLLAVENAGLLAPPVLADLVELTRSETAAGRFLQVLLCGTPDLERTLTRAGLADSLRELGVIYRMAPGAAPSATPMVQPPADNVAAKPAPAGAAAKPKAVKPPAVLAAPEPAPPEPPRRTRPAADHQPVSHQPANDWTGGFDWTDRGADTGASVMPGPPDDADTLHPAAHRPPRRAALYAGAALTTLVLLAAAGAAVLTSVPGVLPDSTRASLERGWERGWTDTRSFIERTLGGLPGVGHDGDALALAAPRAAQAETPAAQPPLPGTPATPTPAAPPSTPSPSTPSVADHPPTAVQPPASPIQTSSIQTAALPPPANASTAQPFVPAPPSTLPAVTPPATTAAPATSEAPPGTAALPPLEEPSHAASAPPAPPIFENEAAQAQRARVLVDQARRQLAGKRLTTPPGDNAYETVQRLRLIAPNAPEAAELTATMEETYRRWAMAAEREADWNEARRFYERALMVSPENPDLRERVKAAGERRSLGPAAPAPATATPGLNGREAVLALLRNPTELSRALQSGTAPDTRLDNGKTLLMMAAEQGLTDAVRILLERHANTGLRTSDGATAVMYAAWGGYESVVSALAEGGADLDATNDDGKTALMAAAARGHQGVATVLLQRGVAVDRTTANGWSALMYAANNGHDRVAKLLLDRGANPYRMDTNGNSALTLGALQGHVQVVEALKPR